MGKLKDSGVRLDRETHRYHLGTKELSGITRRIGDRLGFAPTQFADPRLGIEVHEEIELMGYGIPPKTEHGKAFKAWSEERGLDIIANEYIVTDGERYASPIDFATSRDGGEERLTLWDAKTFKRFTRDSYVRVVYQMNIYSYFFRLVNGYKPDRLMVVQVWEDGCKETEIPFIGEDEVKEMLYSEGLFKSSLIRTDIETPELSELYDIQSAIDELNARKKYLEGKCEELKERIKSEMEKSGALCIETDRVKVTYTKGFVRRSIDAEKLKSYNSELYDELCMSTPISSSVKVTIK